MVVENRVGGEMGCRFLESWMIPRREVADEAKESFTETGG